MKIQKHFRPVQRRGRYTLPKWRRIACKMRTCHAAYLFGVEWGTVSHWKRQQKRAQQS